MDQSRSFDQISGDTSSAVPVIDDDDRRPPVPFPDRNDDYHNTRFFPATTYGYNNEEALRSRGDDRCSCVAVIVTFGIFASMALVLGVYGPSNLQLGPNSSILLKPNPIFVGNIKVEEMDDASNGPTVYGFYENPSLDVLTTFYEAYKTSLPANHHKEWIYYLNQGSQINISYSVNSKNSDSLVLIIAQGSEGLAEWLENPSYPSTELSWNAIHGNGTVSLEIGKSSTYYVAVGNLKPRIVQVRLDIKGIALFYNTAGAYYECNLGRKQCSTRFPFPHGGAVLLTSPPQRPGTASGTWSIKISYGPQWSIYVLGLGALSFLIFGAFWYLKNKQSNRPVGIRDPPGPIQQTPLLSGKDDDLASCGSSFDGFSQDDEYNEDGLDPTAPQGRQVKDGEYNNNARQLCTICFDAPRDCFFLPCGHCASCFKCGTRIAEAAGTCPICRRPMKKVRKIYTV